MSEIGLLEACEDLGVQLEAAKQRQHAAERDLAALRQRHAEAVEAAYKEGLDTDRDYFCRDGSDVSCEDAAWLASEAKARLT